MIIDKVYSSQLGELLKELKKSFFKSDEDDDEFDYEEIFREEI